MIAFSLVILVFSFWAVIGYAITYALNTRRNLMQTALLAPAAGMAAIILLVMLLNCLGLPVRYGGPAATIILGAIAAALFHRCRPLIPLRRLLPFALTLLIAALTCGFPLLPFGFNWVSYGNDDMANYCLGAKLFLNHAQFSVPSIADLLTDRDPSLFYWYFYVLEGIRHGVDELLAWLMSMTGLSAHQAFMPLILTAQLVLISAGGALVLQNRKLRTAALLFCGVSAFSALIGLGSMYQLIAQVTGLGMLAATCTVLLRPLNGSWRQMLFAALLASGTSAFYPEVLPFLGASFLLYHALALYRRVESLRSLIAEMCAIGGFSIVLLNVTTLTTIITMVSQSKSGLVANTSGGFLFPYFLTPAGFAYLWGFHTITQAPSGLILDIGIVVGAALFLCAVVGCLWGVWKLIPSAIVFLTMLGLTIQLYRVRADFGLFKDAMFMQPFLLGTLATIWVSIYRQLRSSLPGRSIWIFALIGIVGWGFNGQLLYTRRSMGYSGSGLVEIPFASSEGLIGELKALPKNHGPLLSDTSNVLLVKFESWYQAPVYFPAEDFYTRVILTDLTRISFFRFMFGDRVYRPRRERLAQFAWGHFDMHGALPSSDQFQIRNIPKTDLVIEDGPRVTVVNRRSKPPNQQELIKLVPESSEKNHLIFVTSQYGVPFYTGMPDRVSGRVSMYEVEPDYFFHDSSMASLGRDSLFLILNPSPEVRLVVEYTASLNGDRQNLVPPASVVGQERRMFAVVGRGSARLFSPAVEPQQILGNGYIALDMGTWGWHFPQRKSRIMSLYGTDVMVDLRKITGFTRDISLISDAEYLNMNAPNAIQHFPADLADKSLEYSGIYEDGWVAESSDAVLAQSAETSALVVRLAVPAIAGRGTASILTVVLDGHEVARQTITPGTVDMKIRVLGEGRHRVGLRFDRVENLPSPDSRPVSAQILYLGFQPDGSKIEGR